MPEPDYTSARFTHAVTFRGITVDSIQGDDRFTMVHSPGAMLVHLRATPPQVRMVPWANVACAEPTEAQLERLTGGKAAKK